VDETNGGSLERICWYSNPYMDWRGVRLVGIKCRIEKFVKLIQKNKWFG
jgi:hypothetical protein